MFIFSEPDRDIDRVFIHCSASSLKAHDSVQVVGSWHIKNGWSDIGYNYYITFDGDVHCGRDVEIIPAAQRGHNTGTIAICLSGLTVDDFTQEQFESLRNLCEQIDDRIPDVTFHGHCEVSSKTCPVFDYRSVLGLDSLGEIQSNSLNDDPFGEIDRGELFSKMDDASHRIETLENKVACLEHRLSPCRDIDCPERKTDLPF